jgi:hypothetical protein
VVITFNSIARDDVLDFFLPLACFNFGPYRETFINYKMSKVLGQVLQVLPGSMHQGHSHRLDGEPSRPDHSGHNPQKLLNPISPLE